MDDLCAASAGREDGFYEVEELIFCMTMGREVSFSCG